MLSVTGDIGGGRRLSMQRTPQLLMTGNSAGDLAPESPTPRWRHHNLAGLNLHNEFTHPGSHIPLLDPLHMESPPASPRSLINRQDADNPPLGELSRRELQHIDRSNSEVASEITRTVLYLAQGLAARYGADVDPSPVGGLNMQIFGRSAPRAHGESMRDSQLGDSDVPRAGPTCGVGIPQSCDSPAGGPVSS